MERLWRIAWLLMLAPPLFWLGNFITGRAVRDAVPPVALGGSAVDRPAAGLAVPAPRLADVTAALGGDAVAGDHRRRRFQRHGLHGPQDHHGAERADDPAGDATNLLVVNGFLAAHFRSPHGRHLGPTPFPQTATFCHGFARVARGLWIGTAVSPLAIVRLTY
jgi:hypothetical protein